MTKFAVFSDSACDLPVNITKKHDITIVPFKVCFDKVNKLTDGVDITLDQFYQKLAASGSMPKTYFPSVRNYVDAFKTKLEEGQDILCICLSSKLSKSYASAVNAAKILSHIYKNNKIKIIDSLLATCGQGMLVLDAVKLSETMNVEAAYSKLDELKKTAVTILTISSLVQLSKGGRISSSAAAVGQMLKLSPIIYLENGALVTKGKKIGRQKAIEDVKRRVISELNGSPSTYDFCVLHTRRYEEAVAIAADLENAQGIKQAFPPIEIGLTIGMHTGESVVSAIFIKKI